MVLIVCLDDRDGMLFNHRRLSRDRAAAAEILRLVNGRTLWMNQYSASLFAPGSGDALCIDENFLKKAGEGDCCFVENADIKPFEEKIEEIGVCRWNRRYPADVWFPIDLRKWRLTGIRDFIGFSHQKLTWEIYAK